MQNEQKFLEFTLKRLIGCCQHLPGIPRVDELDVKPQVAFLAGRLESGFYDEAELFGDKIAQAGVSLDYGGVDVVSNLVSYADERDKLAESIRAWSKTKGAPNAREAFYQCSEAVINSSLHLRICILAEAIALSGKQSKKIDRLLSAYEEFLGRDECEGDPLEDSDALEQPSKGIVPSGDSNLDLNFLVAASRYGVMFPNGDPFVDPFFAMSDAARSGKFVFTIIVFPDGKPQVGTFARDNYGSLPLFAMEFRSAAQKGASVTVRRFEDGPKDRVSGDPYKTIAGAAFRKGKWIFLSEDEMKDAHAVDHKTGRPIPVEAGVLFSTIPELLPGFLEAPDIPKAKTGEVDEA